MTDKNKLKIKILTEKLEKETGKKVVLEENNIKDLVIKKIKKNGLDISLYKKVLPKELYVLLPTEIMKQATEMFSKVVDKIPARSSYDEYVSQNTFNLINRLERFLVKELNKQGIPIEIGKGGSDDIINLVINEDSIENLKKRKTLGKTEKKPIEKEILLPFQKEFNFILDEIKKLGIKIDPHTYKEGSVLGDVDLEDRSVHFDIRIVVESYDDFNSKYDKIKPIILKLKYKPTSRLRNTSFQKGKTHIAIVYNTLQFAGM